MGTETIIALMLITLIFFIVLGHPIGFVLGGVATIFGYFFIGPQIMDLFFLRLFDTYFNYILIAIPLFVFMGIIIEQAGISQRLYEAIRIIMGRMGGGLAITAVLTSTVFAAATGVVGASIVTIGILALPSMVKYKYNYGIATGSICAGGTLGILIPPSILILVYGPTAGLSVGSLFAASIVPGLLLSFLYIVYIAIRCYIRPADGPGLSAEEVKQYSFLYKLKLFLTSVVPVVLLVLAVLGTIITGTAAPTEAAAVGAFASVILAAFYSKVTLTKLKEAAFRTVTTSCMIYMVAIGAGFFTGVFMRLGGGRVVTNLVTGLPIPEWGMLIVMWVIIFLLWMFIDWIGVVMIVVPLFTPIGALLGYNPVWFAMMNIILLQTSFMTPPFAYAIFYVKGIAPPEVKTWDIYWGIIPFVLIVLVTMVLVGIFPDIILFLPRLFGLRVG